MLKVGLLGCGIISTSHTAAYEKLADEVSIVACCDIRPEQMEVFGDIRKYTDLLGRNTIQKTPKHTLLYIIDYIF